MGYYTTYRLNEPEITPEIEETIYELNIDYPLIDEDSCKWYDHEADMLELSRRFPEELFELHGEGEEPGDIWIKYFKNGKMQSCFAKIIFDEFDEKKMI